MKRYISFSGGVESTTMCILYGKGSKAIWCDTGAEFEKLYQRIDIVEEYCKKLHGNDFEVIRIKPKVKIKGSIVDNLLDAVLVQKFMPSIMKRYCTRQFKIEPIDNFLKEQGECELMIGLNSDEENKREGNYGILANVNYTYPLIENDINRKDCEDILNLHGMHPNFPVYMKRGGCTMCFFKSENEYKALYYLDAIKFQEMVNFEKSYQDKKTKFYTILQNGKSLEQVREECKNELFSVELMEMYLKTNQSTGSCGAFCMR